MWIPRDPPRATQGILTGYIWPTQRNLTAWYWPTQGISDKNILTQWNSDPNLKELLHILAFFIYFLSIPTHSPRDFLTENGLSVYPSHAPVLVFVWKHMCYWLANMTKNWQSWSIVWYTTPIEEHFDIKIYTPKGRNTFMTRNFLPIEGTLTIHFLKCQNPLGMPVGGSLGIHID